MSGTVSLLKVQLFIGFKRYVEGDATDGPLLGSAMTRQTLALRFIQIQVSLFHGHRHRGGGGGGRGCISSPFTTEKLQCFQQNGRISHDRNCAYNILSTYALNALRAYANNVLCTPHICTCLMHLQQHYAYQG